MKTHRHYPEYLIYTINLGIIVCILGAQFLYGNYKARLLMDQIQLMNTKTFLKSKSLSGVNVNYKDPLGYTLLHLAVSKGNPSFVRALLMKGANPNAKSKDSYTPLHLATRYGMIIILRDLLKAGADPNIKDHNGKTPIFYAAQRGAILSMKNLVKGGAELSLKDHFGQTALDKSVLYGFLPVTYFLIKRDYFFYKQWVDQKVQYTTFLFRDEKDPSILNNLLDLLDLKTKSNYDCIICEKQNNLLNIPYIGSEYIFRWLD